MNRGNRNIPEEDNLCISIYDNSHIGRHDLHMDENSSSFSLHKHVSESEYDLTSKYLTGRQIFL
jgi:hypothetical protein